MIQSPQFEVDGPNGNKTKWFLQMYPNGFKGTKEYAALYFKLAEIEKIKVPARIELAMGWYGNEEKRVIYRGIADFASKSCFQCPKFIKRDLLMNKKIWKLTKGKLTIVCHIDIEQAVSPMTIPSCQLSADFANLLDDGILTDFVLISSDNNEFKVHKNVLACRSPVFAAMFQQNGMTEAQNNRVKIEDIRGDVLQKMLHFIYTGNAPKIGAMANELLAAADKYQIGRLKKMCERSLAFSLDNENACLLLALADLLSADYLKSEASHFIKMHSKKLHKTYGLEWLAKEHSHILLIDCQQMEENGNKITIKNVNSKIVWEIDNFSSHSKMIESPQFEVDGPNGNKTKWFLQMYPNGFKGTKEYATLHVKLAESEKIKVPARIELAILDWNGNEVNGAIYRGIGDFEYLEFSIGRNLLELYGLFTKGKLTIVCHIEIERAMSPMTIPSCQLSADFANLLDDGILTDFVLISSDNDEFKVHKNVLACRSPVFAAMVQQNGMTEATTNRVKIEDIRGDVLQKMLHFIYTGNAPKIGAMANELLAAADKYQIESLKVLCERSLALSLNNENACLLLALADLHSADYLKSEASHFIKMHSKKVIKTDGWKWLAEEHPRLVVPQGEFVNC